VDACQRVQLQQPGASTSRTNADEMHDNTATQTPTQRRTPADTLRVGWLASGHLHTAVGRARAGNGERRDVINIIDRQPRLHCNCLRC